MRQNWLEWVVLAISAIGLVGLVGFLLVDGITDEARPPEPVVMLHVDRAYEVVDGWILPATVTNDGDKAATGLILRATASVGGADEESEITIDFLPPGTDVDVSFGFSALPDGAVGVVPVGFRLP